MAENRADDIGSPLPSDSDDTTPPNPARNRAQIDYTTAAKPVDAQLVSVPSTDIETKTTKQYKLRAVNDDTYSAVELSNGEEGTAVAIAKPFLLRRTPFDGETVGGKTYTYITASERVVTNANGVKALERIVPEHIVGAELLYGVEVDYTEVEGASAIVALNTNGHHWARVSEMIRFRIVSVTSEYLVCQRINPDGSDITGDTEQVLKPRHLRVYPFDNVSLNGRLYTYTSAQARTVTPVGGGPFDGEDPEDQIIIPPYETDDVIYASSIVDVDTDADPVPTFMDYNIDGRAWAIDVPE